MQEKQSYVRQRLLATLMQVGHGDLKLYVEVGLPAATIDPELFAHLVAWNHKNGEVRDSKVAYPIIALRGLTSKDRDLSENAVAHLCSLGPRELYRAYQFNSQLVKQGHNIPSGYRRMLEHGLKRYLAVREAKPGWWDRAVLSNRKAMVGLYAVAHKKPSKRAQAILFDGRYPNGSVFKAVASLRHMSPQEAAGTILEYKIPFQIAVGAVAKAKDQDIVLAMIEQMSGNELLNSSAMLKRWGVFKSPALRAAYDAALERAKQDRRTHTLKAAKAAEVVGGTVGKKLERVQEERVEALGGIEGDWLVLGDRSSSMQQSVALAREIAALIARKVAGKVHLVFFNQYPTYFNVSGKTLDEIEAETRRVFAQGMTSVGCGLDYILEHNLIVNDIVIVSDGGENYRPVFAEVYQDYVRRVGIEPTVYLLRLRGDIDRLSVRCGQAGVPIVRYGLEEGVDRYSLPNIVNALKARRYGLVDEVMETPLLTFAEVFDGCG